MRRFLHLVLERSWLVVALFALACVFMGVGAFRLKVNSSIESFYPEDNPLIKRSRQVQDAYGTGKAIIAVLFADDVFEPGNLRALRSITENVGSLDGVIKVVSLATTKRLDEVDGELVSSDMLPGGDARAGPSDEDIVSMKKYLATNYAMKDGLLAAKDGKSVTLIARIDRGLDERRMCDEIEGAIRRDWRGHFKMTGTPVLGSSILSIIKGVPVIAVFALAVILLFLALNFRSLLGVALPLTLLLVGLLWGVGLVGWMGVSFLVLMAIAPIAILAVGSSFSLHLLGRYFPELSLGKGKDEAIRAMVTETGLGVFVSGLAISASMLTFLLSEMEMIRGMGLLTAAGVLSCMVATLVLLPALLKLLPAPRIRKGSFGNGGLVAPLRGLGRTVAARPKLVLVAGAVLLALSIAGIFRIVPDTSIVAYFGKDSPAIRGMQAVEKVFGGSMQVNMVVDGDMEDPDLLKALLRFQEEARSIPGVGQVQSLATTVRTLHETLTGEAGMPSSRELVSQELLVYQSSGSVDDITSLANLDYTQGLVSIIARQDSSRESKLMLARLDDLARRTIGDRAKFAIVGDGMVQAILEAIVLKDFIISLTLAVFLVVCIDSLIRSLRAALVTIIVLVFTIALQYGVLGIFGLTFSMATALMGTLAIGVGDYAIHMTVRYMEDRRRGLSPERAVEASISTSGRSILFTSLTLGGGFATLAFSQFVPVADLGKLMVFTVFAVGLASLTLLPAACLLFLRNPNSRVEVSNESVASFQE